MFHTHAFPMCKQTQGNFLPPLGHRMCGTSAQVAGQRRNPAGIWQRGSRVPGQRGEPSHTRRARWQAQPGGIPGTANLRLRGDDFATIRSCWACCTGERAPAKWRTRECWSPQSDKPTAGHRNPTSLQIEQDLSQREMSKELAEIRAKTSELGEKSDCGDGPIRRLDGRATCGPAITRRGGPGLRGLSRFVPPCSAPVSAPLVSLVFQRKGPYLPAFRARSSAVEHLTFNQVVVGSIPTGLTTLKKKERP